MLGVKRMTPARVLRVGNSAEIAVIGRRRPAGVVDSIVAVVGLLAGPTGVKGGIGIAGSVGDPKATDRASSPQRAIR